MNLLPPLPSLHAELHTIASHTDTTATGLQLNELVSGGNTTLHTHSYQPLDAGLTSLAGLTYAADSFVAMSGANTFLLRTIAQTKSDLSLNNVENTAHSTDAHTMTIDGRDVSTDGTKLDTIEAGADITSNHETSHANVVVDGDFTSNGILNRTGVGAYSILALGTDVQAYHANLAAIAGGTWTGAASITTLGTIVTGTWQSTDVGIAYGGTGQSTAQLAINALSAVGAATNEHVLTKDTASGNAIWKVATGGAGYVTRGDPTEHDYEIGDFTADTTWRDLDLSGFVGNNTAAIHMRIMVKDDTIDRKFRFRTKGNSNAFNIIVVRNQIANHWMDSEGWVVSNSDGVVQYSLDAGTSFVRLTLAGWIIL